MYNRKLSYLSIIPLLATVMGILLFTENLKGQTRNYLTGQKTGNHFGGATISLGPGTAGISTPISEHRTGLLGVNFQFYYGSNAILNGSTTAPVKMTAAQDLGLISGLLGAGADVYLQFRNIGNNPIASGTTTYFKLKEKPTNTGISIAVGGLLGIVELQNIKARAYSGATNYSLSGNGQENNSSEAGTAVPTRLMMDKDGEWYAAVTPDASYNAVRLNVALPADLRVADVLRKLETNVYNAFTLTGAACNVLPAFTSPGEATGISINSGALVGGLELSQLVANPQYAINGIATQYSSFSSGVATIGVANTVSQTFYYDHVASVNDGIHVKLGLSNSLIGLSLAKLDGIKFHAYSGTSEIPVYTKGLGELATLLGLDLLNLINIGSSHRELDLNVVPGVAFDRVKIEFDKGLLDVGVIGDALRIYDVSLIPLAPKISVQPNAPGLINVCQGSDASLSVTATVPAGGTITGYQWQYYDGSTWVDAPSGTVGNTLTVSAVTAAMNNRLYRVIVTGGNASCPKQVISGNATLTVTPLPTASISGPTAVCQTGPSAVMTFTGTAGTPPFKFYYKINSGVEQTISTSSTNASVTLPIATTSIGNFTYTLIRVDDAKCTQLQTGSVTVTITGKPASPNLSLQINN